MYAHNSSPAVVSLATAPPSEQLEQDSASAQGSSSRLASQPCAGDPMNGMRLRAQPWGDASESKRFILGTMDQFKWADQLVVLPILTDFKDFVVFDHAHARPYTFSDPSLFDEGCEVNAETASLKALMGGD